MLALMRRIRPLIAVLDDEPQFCKAVARLLKTYHFDVLTFTCGEVFLADCATRLPDCLLLDLNMPDLSGFEILERIATRRMPAFVITSHDQPGNAERVRALGAVNYFLKPVNESQLVDAIRAVIDHPAPTIVHSDDPQPNDRSQLWNPTRSKT
jgi:FixJ family two-component response regulator